jgi:hypothetical protein
MDESKSSWFMWLNSPLFGNDPNYTVLIAAGCPSPKFCQATESIAYSKLLATDLV